ncbi:MAG TPA: hypothetical protein PK876_08260 [Elusimicrobiota bacterium]|nr:hypothetical protein [Elusimicrobiota bacterium]
MPYDLDIVKYQFPIVEEFIRLLAYHRAVKEALDGHQVSSYFWGRISDSFLKVAASEWCKVFGAESNNTHWKKLPVDESEKDSFRNKVLTITNLKQEDWQKYWEEMRNFRDKLVAHLEPEKMPRTPDFKTALVAAYTYCRWVRTLFPGQSSPCLKALYNGSFREAKNDIKWL